MLATLSDPVIVVDDRMLITSANAAAARLFGLPTAEMVGRSCLDWVHEPDRVQGAERMTRLLAGDAVRATTARLLDGDGNLRWVEITGARFVDGGESRASVTIRDIVGRLERELASARSIGRAQLLSQMAVEFQRVTPPRFTETLTTALRQLGRAAGAQVAALYEVEPDGTALVLSGRWADGRDGSGDERPATTVSLADIPRLRTAINGSDDVVEIHPDRREIEDAHRIDPAISIGAIVPLRPADELVAIAVIGWAPDHELTNDERDLAASAGRVLGTALERVRAQQALLESEAMFRDLFHGSSAIMYLVDPATLTLVDVNQAAATFYGYHRESMIGMELHRLTLHTREQLVAVIDAVRADGATTVIDEQQRLSDGSVRAVEIHSTPMRITSREFDLAIVQDVTERRLALEKLERLASTDEMTGAFNRRRHFELVQAILDDAATTGVPVSLLMLDLDHFKRVNDDQGHAAGDAALVEFCNATRRRLRPSDVLGRLGGEEFAVALPGDDLAAALEVGESIRRSVESTGVTVSIGVAEWSAGQTIDQLHARADQRLYEAKQSGRNRVVG